MMNRGAIELDRYDEGDIRYAPNAPYLEEEEGNMNFSHIKNVLLILTTMLCLSYVPGYLSLGTQEWQPYLIKADIVLPDISKSMTLFFGWDSVYSYEVQTSIKFDKSIDNELFKTDLEESGLYYINLSVLSLILFLMSLNKFFIFTFEVSSTA